MLDSGFKTETIAEKYSPNDVGNILFTNEKTFTVTTP